MTTCFVKSCSIGFLCVFFRKRLSVDSFASFSFGFEGGMLDLIALVPEDCLSF